jgi:hypothetical protein
MKGKKLASCTRVPKSDCAIVLLAAILETPDYDQNHAIFQTE